MHLVTIYGTRQDELFNQLTLIRAHWLHLRQLGRKLSKSEKVKCDEHSNLVESIELGWRKRGPTDRE